MHLKIAVLTLAVVMLVSVSEGDSHVASSCYFDYSNKDTETQVAPPWAKNIISCHEQKQHGCRHGYVIETSRKITLFLRPDTKWLLKKIIETTLQCPRMIARSEG